MEITGFNEEIAAQRINNLIAAINQQQVMQQPQRNENGLYYMLAAIEFNEFAQADQARAACAKVQQLEKAFSFPKF